MRLVIPLVLLLCLAGIARSAEDCVKREKDYFGSKYYNKCHCESFSYPDVAKAVEPLGINAEARWVACFTLDAEEWCVCGASLSWKQRPKDKKVCEEKTKKVRKLIDKFTSEKKDFGISAPLICP